MKFDFELNIDNYNKIYINDFMTDIIKDIRNQIIKNSHKKKIYNRSNYISNCTSIKWINESNKYFNINYIINLIINSIKWKVVRNNEFRIYIDKSCLMPLTYNSIEFIARILNNGYNAYKPTWFISNIFIKYQKNINDYWKSYVSLKTKSIDAKNIVKII